mmetsp:Transcript_8075/g.17473  ORF Transcript_8075/g.17473 Transcript_8075/m.17473 type:complete len:258 (-) Transcript_8075:148-921(-)
MWSHPPIFSMVIRHLGQSRSVVRDGGCFFSRSAANRAAWRWNWAYAWQGSGSWGGPRHKVQKTWPQGQAASPYWLPRARVRVQEAVGHRTRSKLCLTDISISSSNRSRSSAVPQACTMLRRNRSLHPASKQVAFTNATPSFKPACRHRVQHSGHMWCPQGKLELCTGVNMLRHAGQRCVSVALSGPAGMKDMPSALLSGTSKNFAAAKSASQRAISSSTKASSIERSNTFWSFCLAVSFRTDGSSTLSCSNTGETDM